MFSPDRIDGAAPSYACRCRVAYVRRRHNPDRDFDLPGGGDGKYEWNVKGPEGYYDNFYHAGSKDLAYMESEYRKYLRKIARSNPELFLEEMTPIAGRNKTERGLDLTEPLHRTYQEEFMEEVARVCREQGLKSHLAWVQATGPQTQWGRGRSSTRAAKRQEGKLF
jgi:hypothetical protein